MPRQLVQPLLSVLLALLLAACGASEPEPRFGGYAADGKVMGELSLPARRPNLIVLVIDALRHDALSPPAGGRAPPPSPRMPFLDGLAARGVSFDEAASPAPWTLPSLTSLLTGLRPSQHGMTAMELRAQVPASVATFAEVLRSAYGYEAAAFTSGPWFQGEGASVLQGFGYARRNFRLQGLARDVGLWARFRDPSRPFFLFLHTYEAHDPYGAENHAYDAPGAQGAEPLGLSRAAMADPRLLTRAAFLDRERMEGLQRALGQEYYDILFRYIGRGYAEDPDHELAAELEDAYWTGVRWVDGVLEDAYARLEKLGLLEDTVLVVTADHGEAFGEHGFLGHGRNLYDESIRIPLVVVGPPPFVGGRRVPDAVGLVDVLPTFLDFAGMQPLAGVEGRSFLPLARGESLPCRAVVSEERLLWGNTREDVDGILLSARSSTWKYLLHYDVLSGEVREEAYDLANDPEELLDLADEAGVLHGDLVFDGCLCRTVTAIRDLVWTASDVGEVPGAPHEGLPATPAPEPCRADAP